MASKKKKLVFEAIQQDDGVFAVKTQPRKNGSWHTACECITHRGNAMEMAQLIARLLNENEKYLATCWTPRSEMRVK
jgi:phage antirepressor YoqD-like protein